jgi:hypothetical protein
LQRAERLGSGTPEWQELLAAEFGAVEFRQAGGTITLRVAAPRAQSKVRRPFEVTAALGGDVR